MVIGGWHASENAYDKKKCLKIQDSIRFLENWLNGFRSKEYLRSQLHPLQFHIADDNILVKNFCDRLIRPGPCLIRKNFGKGHVLPKSKK